MGRVMELARAQSVLPHGGAILIDQPTLEGIKPHLAELRRLAHVPSWRAAALARCVQGVDRLRPCLQLVSQRATWCRCAVVQHAARARPFHHVLGAGRPSAARRACWSPQPRWAIAPCLPAAAWSSRPPLA